MIKELEKKIHSIVANCNCSPDGFLRTFTYRDEMELWDGGLGEHRHKEVILKRRPVSVFLNPPHLPFKEFVRKVRRVDRYWKKRVGQYEMLEHGNPVREVNPNWSVGFRGNSYGEIELGQDDEGWAVARNLFLVGVWEKNPKKVVGHAHFSLRICLDAEGISLCITPDIFWVNPRFRGLGIGNDLLMASKEILQDIYLGLAETLPAEMELDCYIYADYVSVTGKNLTEKLHRELVALREYALKEEEIVAGMGDITLDAGF